MPNPPKSRAEVAEKIASNPSAYKVCEGCDSIVSISTAICPNCHSFRFDEDRESVVSHAKILGSREQQSVTAEDLT